MVVHYQVTALEQVRFSIPTPWQFQQELATWQVHTVYSRSVSVYNIADPVFFCAVGPSLSHVGHFIVSGLIRLCY